MKDDGSLLKEMEEVEREIEEIKKRIPPHSMKYEFVQLLEDKESQLERKRELLKAMEAGPNRYKRSGEKVGSECTEGEFEKTLRDAVRAYNFSFETENLREFVRE